MLRPPCSTRRTALAACALLLSASFPASELQAQTGTKALVGGTLIDGFGAPPLRNSVIVIEGARIVDVGQVGAVAIPADAEVISTEGMSVLPGLWDMHVHLMIAGHTDYTHWDSVYPPLFESVIMPAAARQLLSAGVTSARDLGAPLEASIAVRDAIERGEIPGPTLYVSGPFIQHEPYPGTELFRWGVSGANDARAKVRRLAEAGVDVIKLIDQDQMTMEEVQAVVDEAHRHGLPVVAHSHRPEEIRRGLLAGVDNFEHTGLATAPEYPADVIEMIRARTAQMNLGPLYWTPTIEVLFNYEYIRDSWRELLDAPCWKEGLPDHVIERFKGEIGIDRPGPVAKQHTKVMYLARFTGFDHDADARARPGPNQMMVKTRNREQGRDRRHLAINPTIGQDDNVATGFNRLVGLGVELVQGLLQRRRTFR